MMRKRIAAWALTACMALTLLPLHAGAVPISGPSATETVLPTQVTAAAEENTVHALQAAELPVYTLQKMGNDRENLVLLLLGDGYTQDQQQQFLQEARVQLGRLMALEPYSRLAHRINVYAVPAVSNEAGLSNENNKLDTYFGLTTLFETKSIGFRSDTDGEARVNAIRADLERLCLDEGAFVDNIHMFINTDADVGSASGIYSFSTGGAKDYAMAHELSHSVGKLGDEYGIDTRFPNVSTGSDIKWKKMMGYRSIIACENNDGRVLIPTAFKCNMYQSDQPFCEVCRLALVRRMFATDKIQNGMELYVANPEVTTAHNNTEDSERYRVTQENLLKKAPNIRDLSLRTVIQNLSDRERKVKLVLGVVKANGEPREPLKEEVFTVPALTKNGNMEDACIYPTLTFNPIQGTNFEAGDRLVGEVRDAERGEVLATYQEPEYDTYQVDYLLEDGQSIPNTFTTELLLPKGCGDPFISQWAPRTVGGHAFVRMEREGLALRLYYRQTAQTVPPEKPKLEGAVTIIGTPKYNQSLTATVTNLTPAGAKLTYQWYHDDERIPDAIKETYTPTAEDIGKSVHVAVSAEKCTGVLKSEEVTVAKADAFKMADYDCQMYYHITEVQKITAYNFVPADQVQDAVIKDGVRDMVDPDHIISTEDFTSTTFKLADGLTPADAGKTASWKVIITSTTHGNTTGTITVKITDAVDTTFTADSTSNAQNGGLTGTWAFSGWDGGTLEGTTVVFRGTWSFTPDGGSAGGGSTGGTTPSQPGGSTGGSAVTPAKPDGTKVETTTKPDGSSVTESTAPNGSTGTVKTDKDGKTEAAAKLSDKAIEDAKKNGEAVKAPVEVEATRNSSTAPTVSIELPKGAGETKVEIPVSNANSGTVAVLVHPDGTEEVVKNSLPTENGIQLTVNGGATVKIVDNSKDFADTQNHWAKDAIGFVSARGLVNGMNETTYAPDSSTTRAQLWTILARQNDADLSGGNTWYEKAQNWAKAKGISDGTDPDAAINRAQMVTMLWRAMGQPAAGSAASFTDVPTDSYYAQAVAWAVEHGITSGVGGGRFDPDAACTRAQIAAFLYRSMK